VSSEFVDFERESKSYCEVVAVAPPFPRPPLARGTSVPQLVPSGTLVDRWDLGSPAVRLQVEPSQARIGDCAPLQLGSRKGSVGWVESWTGSPGEGSPKFGDNLRVSRFGEVPKLSGLCPGSPRFPLGPSQGFRITRSESTVVPCDSQVISRKPEINGIRESCPGQWGRERIEHSHVWRHARAYFQCHAF
jgi:hypothetical protein